MNSIVYENEIQVRFSDLDGYGHMNSNIYADLLATSRLLFLEENLEAPLSFWEENKTGFYAKDFKIDYKYPVMGLAKVGVRSQVISLTEQGFDVEFKFYNTKRPKLVHAKGTASYVTVNLDTGRAKKLEEWIKPYIIE